MNVRPLYTLYIITILHGVTAYHIHRMVMTYIFIFCFGYIHGVWTMACEWESPQKSHCPILHYSYTQRRIFHYAKKVWFLSCSALSIQFLSDGSDLSKLLLALSVAFRFWMGVLQTIEKLMGQNAYCQMPIDDLPPSQLRLKPIWLKSGYIFARLRGFKYPHDHLVHIWRLKWSCVTDFCAPLEEVRSKVPNQSLHSTALPHPS